MRVTFILVLVIVTVNIHNFHLLQRQIIRKQIKNNEVNKNDTNFTLGSSSTYHQVIIFINFNILKNKSYFMF